MGSIIEAFEKNILFVITVISIVALLVLSIIYYAKQKGTVKTEDTKTEPIIPMGWNVSTKYSDTLVEFETRFTVNYPKSKYCKRIGN